VALIRQRQLLRPLHRPAWCRRHLPHHHRENHGGIGHWHWSTVSYVDANAHYPNKLQGGVHTRPRPAFIRIGFISSGFGIRTRSSSQHMQKYLRELTPETLISKSIQLAPPTENCRRQRRRGSAAADNPQVLKAYGGARAITTAEPLTGQRCL
jgi:hypothetical protein